MSKKKTLVNRVKKIINSQIFSDCVIDKNEVVHYLGEDDNGKEVVEIYTTKDLKLMKSLGNI